MALTRDVKQILAQYRVGTNTLTSQIERYVMSVWDSLPDHRDASIERFIATITPRIEAAEYQMALSTVAMGAAVASLVVGRRISPPRVSKKDVTGGALRAGTSTQDVYKRAAVTVYNALAEGKTYDEAKKLGRDRALQAVETDMQLAKRQATVLVRETITIVEGVQRVNRSANPCKKCKALNGQITLEEIAIHTNCRCDFIPVTRTEVREYEEPEDTGEDVVVEEHGELGAMMVDPIHKFTKLKDMPDEFPL